MNSVPFFDHFTERARKTISLAQEEAQYFQHNAIGTEHLLLGLVREGEGIPARLLESFGVTQERLRKAVEEAKERGNAPVQGEVGFTPHANMAIEMAMKQAERQFPSRSTGIQMPLIGSIHMPESDALKMLQDGKPSAYLESLGVTLEEVRKAVEEAKGRGVQILIDQRSPANTPTEEVERRRHPHFSVGTLTLFQGILRVPESTGVKILQELGMPSLKDIGTLVYLEQLTTLPITNQGYTQHFTKQARKAWNLAYEEARRLQDSYIGAHHLLLGLVGEGSGVAATVLSEMGIGLERMHEQVKPSYKEGNWNAPGDIPLQPKLKNVIELASNEARRFSHPHIGTGHLLLVLLRGHDDQGIEAGLLKKLGVDLDTLRSALWQALIEKASMAEQEAEAVTDEGSDEAIAASNASLASIERGLQSRELDKTILAVYPFALEVRVVLESARSAAQHLSLQIGPEHLLLGLTFLTFRHEGPVSNVLKDVGINFAGMQAAIEKRQGQGVKATSLVPVHSAQCRACLLLAADEAERRDGQGAIIKSEHLLLALLREEQGVIADLLSDLGTSVGTVRTMLQESLANSTST
jgi:ATP-dependent Clp protease ATP-binding subunit ClpA